MSVEAKIDKIIASQADFKTQQAVMATDMKHLIKDNIEFKQNLATLKADYYITKDKVKILQWLMGLITAGISLILTIFGMKIKF